MDTASLVIGIFCAVIGFIPCLQVVVIVPALVGLILGIISFNRNKQEDKPTGMALAGIILNALPLLVVTALAAFVGFGADTYTINDMTIK